MTTIAAVVLTYNRLDLVRSCIAALQAQTHPFTTLVVVDNGSTDGTHGMLADLAALQAPGAMIVRSITPNRGPAAGFHEAMRLGAETGADFIWLMDDDVIPDPAALAELVAAGQVLAGRGITAPYLLSVAVSPDGAATNVPDLDKRHTVRGYPQWPALLDQGLVPIRRGTFVSALFDRRAVDHHGLPLAELGMWGEDTEYTMRVTRHAPAYLVGRSRVVHVRAQPGSLDIRTEKDPARIRMHRIRVRNHIYNARSNLGRRAQARAVLSMTRLALGLAARMHLQRAAIIGRGLVEGLIFAPHPAHTSPHPSATAEARLAKG